MRTPEQFLAELERDFHLDFSMARGQQVLAALKEFVSENVAASHEPAEELPVGTGTHSFTASDGRSGIGASYTRQAEALAQAAMEELPEPSPEPVAEAEPPKEQEAHDAD